jgi:N-acetylglucosamine kinase-like BadF-type ATPase
MNYQIGVHGDDTQTELILVSPAGIICGQRIIIGCNPDIYLDQDTIRSVLLEGLDALAAQAKVRDADATIAHTLLCLPGSPSFWDGIVARLHHFSKATACPPYLPVLELATRGHPGLVVDCGRLRSFVAARGPDNGMHSARNFGCRLSDPGSDYDLGRRALIRALTELQGWAEPSDLGHAVCTAMKATEPILLATKLNGPSVSSAQVADLAPSVIALAAQGDAAAVAVVRESLGELLLITRDVRTKLFGGSTLTDRPVAIGLRGAILQTALAQQVVVEVLDTITTPVLIAENPGEGLRRLLVRTA